MPRKKLDRAVNDLLPLLRAGERNYESLAKELDVTISMISRWMKKLEKLGYVRREKVFEVLQ